MCLCSNPIRAIWNPVYLCVCSLFSDQWNATAHNPIMYVKIDFDDIDSHPSYRIFVFPTNCVACIITAVRVRNSRPYDMPTKNDWETFLLSSNLFMSLTCRCYNQQRKKDTFYFSLFMTFYTRFAQSTYSGSLNVFISSKTTNALCLLPLLIAEKKKLLAGDSKQKTPGSMHHLT